MSALVTGPFFRFADRPNDQVPRRAAGPPAPDRVSDAGLVSAGK
jgi:hypothetical protein